MKLKQELDLPCMVIDNKTKKLSYLVDRMDKPSAVVEDYYMYRSVEVTKGGSWSFSAINPLFVDNALSGNRFSLISAYKFPYMKETIEKLFKKKSFPHWET